VLDSGATDGKVLAIVVTATKEITLWTPDGGTLFENSCFLITNIGDLTESKYPLAEIALKKARVSAVTGLPTSKVPPQYLLYLDTLYWGSAVIDGIVAACSGVDPHHDEMFSYWIAAAVQAEAKAEYNRYLRANADFVK
jgi:hypothetical protein